MNDIVNILYYALDDGKKDNSPFVTAKTEKAFDSAYEKWMNTANFSANNREGDCIVHDALAEIVSEEREQAFKIGLRTALRLLTNFN